MSLKGSSWCQKSFVKHQLRNYTKYGTIHANDYRINSQYYTRSNAIYRVIMRHHEEPWSHDLDSSPSSPWSHPLDDCLGNGVHNISDPEPNHIWMVHDSVMYLREEAHGLDIMQILGDHRISR